MQKETDSGKRKAQSDIDRGKNVPPSKRPAEDRTSPFINNQDQDKERQRTDLDRNKVSDKDARINSLTTALQDTLATLNNWKHLLRDEKKPTADPQKAFDEINQLRKNEKKIKKTS